jgi:hypothetical protein
LSGLMAPAPEQDRRHHGAWNGAPIAQVGAGAACRSGMPSRIGMPFLRSPGRRARVSPAADL